MKSAPVKVPLAPRQPIPKRPAGVLGILARILGALALLAASLFCVFGFLESFEPGGGTMWKIGYGASALGLLFGAMALLRRNHGNV